MTEENVTFVLTGGGHNAGIISEPGHSGHAYHVHERKKGDAYLNPTNWLEIAEKREGSWWREWHDWLVQQSTKKRILPPVLNTSLPSAPGTYVLQK